MNFNNQIDLRQLTRWLGPDGTRAGLSESKLWTIELLKNAAISLGIKFPDKISRAQLIDQIVRVASKRITKSMDELYGMSYEEIVDYLQHLDVEATELLDLLKELDLSPRREGKQSLIQFAAKQLSETGRFMQIAQRR